MQCYVLILLQCDGFAAPLAADKSPPPVATIPHARRFANRTLGRIEIRAFRDPVGLASPRIISELLRHSRLLEGESCVRGSD